MDPMVSSCSSVVRNGGVISDGSDNADLLDFCFLCSRQFFHDNLDNYGTERQKPEDVLETFFEELGPVDRALLQCCPSCQALCKTLTRTKEALSSLIGEITNLLLRSKKVSYLLSKSRVVGRLFQSSNISLPPCEVSSGYLQQSLNQINFQKEISGNNSSNCFPTQFNLGLDSSNLSDGRLGFPISQSSLSCSSVKKCSFKSQSENDNGANTPVTCPSPFSCIYDDSIMNSVCDNACDISEDIKVDSHSLKIPSSHCHSMKESSSPTVQPNDIVINEKNGVNFKSSSQEFSGVSFNTEQLDESIISHQTISSRAEQTSTNAVESFKDQKLIPGKGATDQTTLSVSSSYSKLNATKIKLVIRKNLVKSPPTIRSSKQNINCQQGEFSCKVCGVQYKTKKGLKNHVSIHKGESKFWCDLCSKSFSQKIGLDRHLRIHSRKFEYNCDLCGKQFLHHTSFKAHKLIHIGVKEFQCPHCDQSFLQNSKLQRHLKVHSGDKPHRCPRCKRSFKESYNLREHMKSHESSIDLHECSECPKTYTRKFKLKLHMKQFHNIVI